MLGVFPNPAFPTTEIQTDKFSFQPFFTSTSIVFPMQTEINHNKETPIYSTLLSNFELHSNK